MTSFDTNVAVRLLVEDDPAQCERAERAFRQAVAEGGVFFSAVVLVEGSFELPASKIGQPSRRRSASSVGPRA
jgi:predicted nucleic-acid-binding protein